MRVFLLFYLSLFPDSFVLSSVYVNSARLLQQRCPELALQRKTLLDKGFLVAASYCAHSQSQTQPMRLKVDAAIRDLVHAQHHLRDIVVFLVSASALPVYTMLAPSTV